MENATVLSRTQKHRTQTASLPVDTAPPAISGNTTQGQILTAASGAWSGSTPISYGHHWDDCDGSGNNCQAITSATGQTYTLTASDVGHTIRVQETATNAGGNSSPATSAATGIVAAASTTPTPTKPTNSSAPAISGTTTDGLTLSASNGTWSGTTPISYTYQWARCTSSCSSIIGATSSTYTLTSADVGEKIAVIVTATNSAGTATAASAEVGPIAAAGVRPSQAQVKAALTTVLKPTGKAATTKAIAKAGGYSFSFSAPNAGTLIVDWFATVNGKQLLVGSANVTFHAAGNATVKLKLTGKGHKLLKSGKPLKINTTASFTPTGATATRSSRTTRLKA